MTVTRLALIFGPLGTSFYGQSDSEFEAARIAFSELKYAEGAIVKLKEDAQIQVHIFDYEPWDRIRWSGDRVFGEANDGRSEEIAPIGRVLLDYKGNFLKGAIAI